MNRTFMLQFAEQIGFLHSYGVVHGRLLHNRIHVTMDSSRLAFFGFDNPKPQHISPTIIRTIYTLHDSSISGQGTSFDVYSCGVWLLDLFNLKKSDIEQTELTIVNNYKLPSWLSNLLAKCVHRVTMQRCTMDHVVSTLQQHMGVATN